MWDERNIVIHDRLDVEEKITLFEDLTGEII